MRRLTVQGLIALLVVTSLTSGFAANASIGIAIASGPFRVNQSAVKGNASLFEGSEVATDRASSKLRMNGGARLEIGTDSRARVYGDHVVLENGAGQLEAGTPYRIEARTLRISTASAKSIARVQLSGADAVLVSALNGPVSVTGSGGQLLAKLEPGNNLRFVPQASAPDSYEVTGCLLRKGGKAIIVDETTNQFFEVRGADRSTEFGNRVTVKGRGVTGVTPLAGASAMIDAQTIALVAPGGCLATAAALGADAPAPPGGTGTQQTPPTPKSGGANKAVIAGVVIGGGAAAGLGLALAGGNKSR